MHILEDWCISRQIEWGHPIPAWHCQDCQHIQVSFETQSSPCEQCGSKKMSPDKDVLDTWFSSALWPFVTLGWPHHLSENPTEGETKIAPAEKAFYPTDLLVTGHDILFFWVARMVMMAMEFKEEIPFRQVYLHGLVRDEQGRKMSKSLGNSVDPVGLIEKYGADALRFTLLSSLPSEGKDLKFSLQKLEGYRNFMNKIWNAARFINQNTENLQEDNLWQLPPHQDLSSFDKWILYKCKRVTEKVSVQLEHMQFAEASSLLYQFIWHDFCDWYLEFSKIRLYDNSTGRDSSNQDKNTGTTTSTAEESKTTTATTATTATTERKKSQQQLLKQIFHRILRLLHPFCPFMTEALFQSFWETKEKNPCIKAPYPNLKQEKAWWQTQADSLQDYHHTELIKKIITSARNIRGENRISPKERLCLSIQLEKKETKYLLQEHSQTIGKLAGLKSLNFQKESEIKDLKEWAITKIEYEKENLKVMVSLAGLIDFEEEKKRLQKQLLKLDKQLGQIKSKLDNKNFIEKAPSHVIHQYEIQLQQVESKIQFNQKALHRLSL